MSKTILNELHEYIKVIKLKLWEVNVTLKQL